MSSTPECRDCKHYMIAHMCLPCRDHKLWTSYRTEEYTGPAPAARVPVTLDTIDQLAGLVGVGLRLIRTHEGWAILMPGHDIVSARTLAEVVELALDVAHAPAREVECE